MTVWLLGACQIFTESQYYNDVKEWNVTKKADPSFNGIEQPGDKLTKYLLNNISEENNNISTLLRRSGADFNQLLTFSESNPEVVIKLLLKLSGLDSESKRTPTQIALVLNSVLEADEQQKALYISAMMLLYPIYTYRISALLADINPKFEVLIKSQLKSQKHLPKLVFPRQQKLAETVKVTPLINSLSVTLFNQLPDQTPLVKITNIEKRETKLVDMHYEPVQGAFSGTSFYLEANTKYLITIYQNSLPVFTNEVETRTNKPLLDSRNVHQLKNIYSDGQLNIKELGIKGKEGAWATIDGTGVVINSKKLAAINVGDSSYIYFRNITIAESGRHGIISNNAHHLWFDNCNISNWGRKVAERRGGRGFESSKAKNAINHDAAFALKNTGVVVIENCEVHSPKEGSNSWKFGHPMGPTAMLLAANHPNDEYDGQYIVRNNRFYADNYNRFNDVIESRNNGRVWGGFIRDSVIHNNYFAYANDDAIEIDGGANNVSVYENEICHTFVGVSAIPIMMGPSYVFNNTFCEMGDQRGKWFTELKLGGLFSRPSGVVIVENNNGTVLKPNYSSARFLKNRDFWLKSVPNIK